MIALGIEQAQREAEKLGFPVVVRPSYVLGGRAMEVVHSRARSRALHDGSRSRRSRTRATPDLIDEYLEDAIEVDVDCLCDGKVAIIGGVLQHVEEAGVHSGDSTMCCRPTRCRPKSRRASTLRRAHWRWSWAWSA